MPVAGTTVALPRDAHTQQWYVHALGGQTMALGRRHGPLGVIRQTGAAVLVSLQSAFVAQAAGAEPADMQRLAAVLALDVAVQVAFVVEVSATVGFSTHVPCLWCFESHVMTMIYNQHRDCDYAQINLTGW